MNMLQQKNALSKQELHRVYNYSRLLANLLDRNDVSHGKQISAKDIPDIIKGLEKLLERDKDKLVS